MKRLILEDNTPTNTDKYPIKSATMLGKPAEIGMKDNNFVYREKNAQGQWGEWKNAPQEKQAELKLKHYKIADKQSVFDTPENTDTNVNTKQKCAALKTPPAGLTLNIKNPGDKNYIYGKVGEEWFAQNVKNKKIFNLTKCNYTSSIAKLEKLKPGSTNASVEDLKNQSVEIQKSAGLPQTGSFDIESLEKLITFLSDEERPKVQSVNSLTASGIKGLNTPSAEEQLKQIASQLPKIK